MVVKEELRGLQLTASELFMEGRPVFMPDAEWDTAPLPPFEVAWEIAKERGKEQRYEGLAAGDARD